MSGVEAKISKTSAKMGKGVWSVSMRPVIDCAKACKGCYAVKLFHRRKQTTVAWTHNGELCRRDPGSFVGSIHRQIDRARVKPKFFRWHVAGDFIDQLHVDSARSLARAWPEIRFLAFTKRHELDWSDMPENFSVILSMWPDMPEPDSDLRKAWMIPRKGSEPRVPSNAVVCPGGCESCGMWCWLLPRLGLDVAFHQH